MTATKEDRDFVILPAEDRPKFTEGSPFLGDFSKRDLVVIETVKRYFRGPLTGPVVVPKQQESHQAVEELVE